MSVKQGKGFSVTLLKSLRMSTNYISLCRTAAEAQPLQSNRHRGPSPHILHAWIDNNIMAAVYPSRFPSEHFHKVQDKLRSPRQLKSSVKWNSVILLTFLSRHTTHLCPPTPHTHIYNLCLFLPFTQTTENGPHFLFPSHFIFS